MIRESITNFFRKRIVQNILKFLVLIGSVLYVYIQIEKNGGFSRLGKEFTSFDHNDLKLLLVVFILIFLNWGIESFKWQLLIRGIEKIGFYHSFKAIFSGITLNNFVPYRSGDFLGRILFLKPGNRTKAILLTLAGTFSQFLTTIFFGITGTVYQFYSNETISNTWLSITYFLLIAALLIFYFNLPKLAGLRIFRKYEKTLSSMKEFSRIELFNVLMLSMIRYVVFLIQFYLLFLAFGINSIPVEIAASGIMIVFMLQAVSPALIVTEIGIRGAVILFVFQKYKAVYLAGLLGAAYSIWLLNLLFPSLIGALFIFMNKRANNDG